MQSFQFEKINDVGVGGMAEQLRLLVALPEDPVSVPSSYKAVVCNSSSRGFDTLTKIDIHAGKHQSMLIK